MATQRDVARQRHREPFAWKQFGFVVLIAAAHPGPARARSWLLQRQREPVLVGVRLGADLAVGRRRRGAGWAMAVCEPIPVAARFTAAADGGSVATAPPISGVRGAVTR